MSSQITLRDIQERMAEDVPAGRVDEPTVRRLWWAALDTLQNEILAPIDLTGGLWLASPLPALYEPKLLDRLQGWVWAPDALKNLHTPHVGLLPQSTCGSVLQENPTEVCRYNRLPLRQADGDDPFLLIVTPEIQLALALQGKPGKRNLLMRSDPKTLRDLLAMLDLRLKDENLENAIQLRRTLADLGQLRINENIERAFWPLLSARLAGMVPSLTIQTHSDRSVAGQTDYSNDGELTLLEALTHEVRTPLATIRTLIRSLLRRKDLSELVVSRLKQIDSECTEQIDRFGLIFSAAALERQRPESSQLASTDLGRMLEMLHPVWSKQLERRGLTLHLDITPDLPHVLSDPQRLELMLGGLIDRNTRRLKAGGSLSLELRPAGQRLKLQFLSKAPMSKDADTDFLENHANSELGPVLSWNPVTGSLQLSQAATQRFLASLGGRLTHRRDSGLTVFFPISEAKN